MILEIDNLEIDLSKQCALTVEIDGHWNASEFGKLFRCMNHIYRFKCDLYQALFHKQMLGNAKYANDKQILHIYYTKGALLKSFLHDDSVLNNYGGINTESYGLVNNELEVKKIKFSSPGIVDFFGIAGVLGHMCDLLKYYVPNKKEKMETEKLRQESIDLQIKNLKAIGLKETEIQKLMMLEEINFEVIKELAEQGLIKAVKLN